MSHIPNYQDYGQPWSEERVSITVYPPSATARPIGYTAWVAESKKKRKHKKKSKPTGDIDGNGDA